MNGQTGRQPEIIKTFQIGQKEIESIFAFILQRFQIPGGGVLSSLVLLRATRF